MKPFLLGLLWALVLGASAQELHIDSCYQWTRAHYPKLRNQPLQAQSHQLRLANLRTQYLPRIELNAKAQYQSEVTSLDLNLSIPGMPLDIPVPPKEQFRLSLDVQQIIYDGGRTHRSQELENSLLAIQQQSIETELYAYYGQVNDLYFGLLLLQQSAQQLDTLHANLLESQLSLQSAIRNGLLPTGADEDLQVALTELQQKQLHVRSGMRSAYALLGELCGRDLSQMPTLSLPVPRQTTQAQRPEVKLLKLQHQQTQYTARLLGSQRLPTLAAYGQLGYGNPGLNMLKDEWTEFWIVGAQLSWPIWDWHRTHRQRQEANIQAQQIDNQLASFEQNLQMARLAEQARIDEWQQQQTLDQQILRLRQNIARRSASQLSHGLISTAEFVQKQTAAAQARIQVAIGQLELLRCQINLQHLSGYDPAHNPLSEY